LPHAPQNFAPSCSSDAQREQAFMPADSRARVVRSFPHCPQRAVPGAADVPQDEQ
jgi:hypothetical protein